MTGGPVAPARLLFPAIRWDPGAGAWDVRDDLDGLADLGVGGYILFGGPVEAVAELTAWLRERSRHPILIGADLERGAGQQFDGATPLPPAAALASVADLASTRRAGELTGLEAAALGVDWVYAPVADLDLEPENPIVGTRSFGADPDTAARHVRAWIEGCRAAGAMACAKHFPGHGRTTSDSHLGLPSVAVDRATLDAELAPFRAAMAAGVESVMTAHVAFPELDPAGAPATLSGPVLHGLLRETLGFGGIVVTDALVMEGVHAAGAHPGVRAVAAGCDALLYPGDPAAVADELAAARGDDLPEARLAEAVSRIRAAAESRAASRSGTGPTGPVDRVDVESSAGTPPEELHGPAAVGRPGDRAWALNVAYRSVHVVRGDSAVPRRLELVTVDDDVGGPYPAPDRSALPDALQRAGLTVTAADRVDGEPEDPVVVAVYADIRGYKGRPSLSDEAVRVVERAVSSPSSLVVLFGHPRLAEQLPGNNVVCAWGGEPLMQEAAAVWIAREAGR